ncbi:c-type cytochrome biogenesis protein CcmI [Candidatus Thiothrix sp. Deng01]|uniref:C-type cytochrome biogenesis protein CcmI n=1 Tax=Candidatus Thiothrix phosphatis TaxID=3112415 RepID=A0ABU6D2R9_9GAMM|nr:c-type cytochrome biogenesis protein CcmI [Candidatus Thiothrix sp. Deng01]MEB4593338.1 c-type cytochrome biogenesis protein CcmI [Candidatus Thiothrix sp. Deng01]
MITFWVLAAGLTLLGVALLLPALLRPGVGPEDGRRAQNIAIARQHKAELEAEYRLGGLDATSHEAALAELERGLYEDTRPDEAVAQPQAAAKGMALLLALLTPLLAFGLYGALGSPAAVPESSVQPNAMPEAHLDAHMGEGAAPDMGKMLAGLEERLKAAPHDVDGWLMLGRSYVVLGRYPDAIRGYERAAQLNPDEPAVLFAWADTLAASQQGSFQGKALELLTQGLALDPRNPMGLWLAASAAMQTGNAAQAIHYWNTLLPLLPEGSPELDEIRTLVRQAGGTPVR